MLSIEDTHEGEKIDPFIEELKYPVRVELLKPQARNVEDTVCMALNVDSAL